MASSQNVFLWSSLAVLLPSNLLSLVLACLVFWVSRRLGSFPWPNLALPLSSSPTVSLWVWSRLSSVGTSSSTRASVSAPVLFQNVLSVGRLSHLSIWNPSWLFEPTQDPTTDRDKISNDASVEGKKTRSLSVVNYARNNFCRPRIDKPFPKCPLPLFQNEYSFETFHMITIGPLHNPVTWYGIYHAGTQITQ